LDVIFHPHAPSRGEPLPVPLSIGLHDRWRGAKGSRQVVMWRDEEVENRDVQKIAPEIHSD
jgi:hypothetical protein